MDEAVIRSEEHREGRERYSSAELLTAWFGSFILHALALIALLAWPSSPPERPSLYATGDPRAGADAQQPAQLVPAPSAALQTPAPITPSDFRAAFSSSPDADAIQLATPTLPDVLTGSALGFGEDDGSSPSSGFPVIGLSGEGDWGLPGGSGGSVDGKDVGLHHAGSAPAFFGIGSSGKPVTNVVYVVDRSGSMTDTFEAVREEIIRSVSALRRSQKFHVLFFNTGPPLENPPARLIHAVQANKQPFFEFLKTVTPGRGTDPIPALTRAFELQPDLIYVLSDGVKFPEDLVTHLDKLNSARQTIISTVAYLDPLGRTVLEQIAREHGGEFVYVSGFDN